MAWRLGRRVQLTRQSRALDQSPPPLMASAHCQASTCASRPRPADILYRYQAAGHRSDQPVTHLVTACGTGRTAAGMRWRPRPGAPGASAAHRRRSAQTRARRRSPARLPSARPPRRSRPGSPRCRATSSAHGRNPPRPPDRDSASRVVDAPRSSRPPTAGSAPRPTPAGRAAPPRGACAGRRQSRRSAPACLRARLLCAGSSCPPARVNAGLRARTHPLGRIGFWV